MTILFNPSGHLDVAADPSDLPQAVQNGTIISGAMTRCKNLRLDRAGMAQLRHGSSKLNAAALDQTTIYRLMEQGGVRYAMAGTKIYEDESAIETGLTAALWSALKYNAYNSSTQAVFCLNGTDRKKIEGGTVYEWGITAPAAPTIEIGALTGLTGAYNAKITFLRKTGDTVICESDPSEAAAAAVTLSNESLKVSWTASTDAQVTHVRVYRTEAGGATYYFDQDVAIGTTSVDSNTADGSLTSTTPATDHDRPPLGTICAGPTFDGYCFIAKDNELYFCQSKQPEYWPLTYFIEVGSLQFPITALVIFNGQIYTLTQTEIYAVQGTGYKTFFPVPMSALCGTRGQNAAAAAAGHGIFHLGSDGIYLFNGSLDKNVTDQRFRPVFEGTATNGIPGINTAQLDECWMLVFRNHLWFAYPGGANTTPSDLLVTDLGTGKTKYYEYGNNFTAAVVDETNDRLLVGDASGYLWEVEDTDETDDDGTAVSWELQSKDYTLPTRAHFPRWVKYDVDAGGAASATGEVLLEGTSRQSHTLTADRDTRRRLVATGNGNRMALKLSGSGPIEIFALEAE